MIFQENITLAPYTTFKIGGPARFFCIVTSIEEVKEAVIFARSKNISFFVLGGGSNLLISDHGYEGLVIKIEIKYLISNSKSPISCVSVGAGENWDNVVAWTLEQGCNGLENLSSIPGTVGAAAVQNIGAYGVEVSQYIHTVHAIDTKTLEEVSLTSVECDFGYRNSLFKFQKGKYIITSVDFVLKRDGKVNTEYKDVKEYINNQVTPSDVRKIIIDIRRKKLPDWNAWGTAGSFFKNPIVAAEKYAELKKMYADMPGYPESDGKIKIPLGWVLEYVCQIKGIMQGNVGTYEKQALVVVTRPGASATDVVAFTSDIMKQVNNKTGIVVEAEVEWVN
jgi:UDP-N-acetylmuramate dehydrogenase